MEFIFEILFEGLLEGLFGCFKAKPQKRPELIEHQEEFTVHISQKRKTVILSLYGFLSALFLFLSLLVDRDTAILFYIFGGLTFTLFVLMLFIYSNHYDITDDRVKQTRLFLPPKEILWRDVICVRIINQTDNDDIIIALYQKDKKLAIDVSTKFENAWQVVKMAEDKGIEIREEKDLSLKQIKHL